MDVNSTSTDERTPKRRREDSDSESESERAAGRRGGKKPELDGDISRARRLLSILEARKRLQELEEERVQVERTIEVLKLDGAARTENEETTKTWNADASSSNDDRKQVTLECNRCWQTKLECTRTKNTGQGCDACIHSRKVCVLRRGPGKKGNKSKSKAVV